MSLRAPGQFWRQVIVGCVDGSIGALAGLLLSLIPRTPVVLMVVCGLIGGWLGSRQERDLSKSPK